MGPFKGELPVFARLSPVRLLWRVPRRRLTLAGLAILGLGFTTKSVRSAILATAGLLVESMLGSNIQYGIQRCDRKVLVVAGVVTRERDRGVNDVAWRRDRWLDRVTADVSIYISDHIVAR